MQSETWYKSWFNTPYYHKLYRHRDVAEAASFIDVLFRYLRPAAGASILDTACGKGRHSVHMASLGYNVTGIDLSENNIEQARKNESAKLKFEVHDMRKAFRGEAFDYVFNLFTSFGYFETMDENLQALQAAWSNLKTRGTLVIDFMNVTFVINNLISTEQVESDGVLFNINRSVNGGFISKNIEVHDGDEIMHFEEKVMALQRQDFMSLLFKAGFSVEEIFGDYHLGGFNETTSPRLIIIARKKR